MTRADKFAVLLGRLLLSGDASGDQAVEIAADVFPCSSEPFGTASEESQFLQVCLFFLTLFPSLFLYCDGVRLIHFRLWFLSFVNF